MEVVKKLFDHFFNLFKFIEENTQIHIIKNISKNNNGQTLIEIGPITSNTTLKITIIELFKNKSLLNLLRQRDQFLLKTLVYAEGDIIILEKIYTNEGEEKYSLTSLISNEKWTLTANDLLKNTSLLSRLNINIFKKDLIL